MARNLYNPITPYQTRLLCLDGDNGLSDSQVSCSLYTADLLHTNVEGLLVRSTASATESLITYDALSYAWGSGGKFSEIRCNGLQVLVTENLFKALYALRSTNKNARYLWVDALCINQDDSSEKNEQVWNMLAIYQKARKVIAWLGPGKYPHMRHVLLAASESPFSSSSENTFDFWSAVEGVSYLYKRPWFKRLWVQQEIFAARELEFQCGNLCFEWYQMLSDPELLLGLPHLRPYGEWIEDRKRPYKKTSFDIPEEVVRQTDAILKLAKTRKQDLKCFQIFAVNKSNRPEFVDALLHTGSLDATNPRDYIYGIIGMTGYPAKAMRIQDWFTARQSELFIPIDYSADLTAIMCAVTWVLLMKDGLWVLAHFKFNTSEDNGTGGQLLPSWVIDWPLSARFFEQSRYATYAEVEGDFRNVDSHNQFCKDNKDNKAPVPYNKLILRGVPDSRFYIKKNSVWEKRLLRPDTVAWRLKFDIHKTDLIVRMNAFLTSDGKHRSGLWLLRPAGKSEFKLIACLAWATVDWHSLYKKWDVPWRLRGPTIDGQRTNECRRLAVDSETERYWPKGPGRPSEFWPLIDQDADAATSRTYTIV